MGNGKNNKTIVWTFNRLKPISKIFLMVRPFFYITKSTNKVDKIVNVVAS